MIKIGIVGCGRILPAHLLAFRRLRELGVQGFRISALCARRCEDAEMFVRRGHGPKQRAAVSSIPGDPLAIDDQYLSDFQDVDDVRVYTDYRQMIAEADINAVHDYSTHHLHHLVADEAFRRGCHLLTQKPLAVTMSLARRMCDQAEQAGIVFGVCENWRFRPDVRRIKWLLESGRLGTLQMILMGNVACWWGPDLVVAETAWRHQARLGGGISLDMGVHQFHFVRYLVGEIETLNAQTAVIEPKRRIVDESGSVRETCECDADDTYFAGFRSEGGVIGSMAASWAGHGAPLVIGGGPVLYGSRGQLAGDQWTADGESPQSLQELYDREAESERRERDFPLQLTDTLALLQYDWLRAIEEQRLPEASGREGLRDLACAFSILESAHGGRQVRVQDVLDGQIEAYQRVIADHIEAGQ